MNANEYEQQVASLGNIIARLTKENDTLRSALTGVIYRAQQGLQLNEWRNAFREGGPDPDRFDDSREGCAGRLDDEDEYDRPEDNIPF